MDDRRFDDLARVLGRTPTRRHALRLLAGGALGGLLGWRLREEAGANHGCHHNGVR